MKNIGGKGVRGGNLALILSGILLIFLGITTSFSTGIGSSSIVIVGFNVSNVLMIIIGFLLIVLALRANVSRTIVKSGN